METQIKERPAIELIEVVSSQIAKIGHDPKTNTLAIQFPPSKSQPDGSIYHYRNFTREDYVAFMTAESKGKHFKQLIKNEVVKYPYERIQ